KHGNEDNHSKVSSDLHSVTSESSFANSTAGAFPRPVKRLFSKNMPATSNNRASIMQSPRISSLLDSVKKRKLTVLDTEKDFAQHKEKLQSKTKELGKIQKEFDDMNRRVQRENEERHALQLQQLNTKYMEVISLQTRDLEVEKKNNLEMLEKLNDCEECLELLQTQYDKTFQENQDLLARISSLEQEVANQNEKIIDFETSYEQIKTSYSEKESEYSIIEKKFADQTLENLKLLEQLEETKITHAQEIESLNAELENQKIESEKAENDMNLQIENITNIYEEKITSLVQEKNNEHETLNQNISKYENSFLSSFKNLQKELEKSSLIIKEKTAENTKLLENSSSLENQIQHLKDNVRSLESTISNSNQNTEQVISENKSLNQYVSQLSDKISKYEEEINQTKRSLSKSKSHNSELKKELNQKEETILSLRDEHFADKNELESELASVREALHEYVSEFRKLEQLNTQLKEQNKNLADTITFVESELETSKSKVALVEGTQKSKIQALEEDIQNKSNENEKLNKTIDSLNYQIKDLESQNEEMADLINSGEIESIEKFVFQLFEDFDISQNLETGFRLEELNIAIRKQNSMVAYAQEYKTLANQAIAELDGYKSQYEFLKQTLVNAEQDMIDMQNALNTIQSGEGGQYKFLGVLVGCFNFQLAFLKQNYLDAFIALESSLFDYCVQNKVFSNKSLLSIARISLDRSDVTWERLVNKLMEHIPDSLQLATADILKLHLESILAMLQVEQTFSESLDLTNSNKLQNTNLNGTPASNSNSNGNSTSHQKIGLIEGLKEKISSMINEKKALEKSVLVLSTKLAALEREFLSYKEVWFDQA
ncbi:hypothetical protein BB560_004808, partial [Smittium megazygosporum]